MTEPFRRQLRLAISDAVRARIEQRRCCPSCGRWLEPDEFAAGCSRCSACEALRVAVYRRRRRVAA